MPRKQILQIGLDPNLVDFSHAPPGVDADYIRNAGRKADQALSALGYEVRICKIDLGETAEQTVLTALDSQHFDCIMIGAGLRTAPEHTVLFEKIVNLVHERARSSKICFNTHPSDTADAVRRWA